MVVIWRHKLHGRCSCCSCCRYRCSVRIFSSCCHLVRLLLLLLLLECCDLLLLMVHQCQYCLRVHLLLLLLLLLPHCQQLGSDCYRETTALQLQALLLLLLLYQSQLKYTNYKCKCMLYRTPKLTHTCLSHSSGEMRGISVFRIIGFSS